MTSLSTLIYYPRSIGLFSTGIFSGLGISLTLVSVPAIKATKDPLPSFIKTLNNASKLGFTSVILGTAANAACYYRTNDKKFLCASVLAFFTIPFTYFFITPVNNELFALEKLGDDYDRNKAYALMDKWAKLNAIKTVAGTASFIINLVY